MSEERSPYVLMHAEVEARLGFHTYSYDLLEQEITRLLPASSPQDVSDALFATSIALNEQPHQVAITIAAFLRDYYGPTDKEAS